MALQTRLQRSRTASSSSSAVPAQLLQHAKAPARVSALMALPQGLRLSATRSPAPARQARSGRSRTAVAVQASATKPWAPKNARLVLEDGTVFHGTSFGATGTQIGEVVFNTSMSGYQEIMTDPSYKCQFVCFTHPHIGNVGINKGE